MVTTRARASTTACRRAGASPRTARSRSCWSPRQLRPDRDGRQRRPARGLSPRPVPLRQARAGRARDLRGSPARPAPPAPGFAFAIELDYAYTVQGAPCLGQARCNVAPSYDMVTMMATWAAADARQWPQYAPWLPALASQIVITSGAAFGARGIAQQNLANSIALGAQARANREWSERQWAAVTQQRNDAVNHQHAGFRENLGAVSTWSNSVGYQDLELPTTFSYYSIDRAGGDCPAPTIPARSPTPRPATGRRCAASPTPPGPDITMPNKLATFLWFDHDAEAAARLYCSSSRPRSSPRSRRRARASSSTASATSRSTAARTTSSRRRSQSTWRATPRRGRHPLGSLPVDRRHRLALRLRLTDCHGLSWANHPAPAARAHEQSRSGPRRPGRAGHDGHAEDRHRRPRARPRRT